MPNQISPLDRGALDELDMMIRNAPPHFDAANKYKPLRDRIAQAFNDDAELRREGLLSDAGIALELERRLTLPRLFVEQVQKNHDYGVQKLGEMSKDIDEGRVFLDASGEWQRRPEISRDPVDIALRREWRDIFRTLDSAERREVVRNAIENNDFKLLEALAETSPTLPLLTADHHQMLILDRRRRAGVSQTHQRESEQLQFEERIIDRAKRALGM